MGKDGLPPLAYPGVCGHQYVGEGPEYGSRKWGKFVFLAEVAELENTVTDELDKVQISLADDEHRAYSWITEEDVGAYDFIGDDQSQKMLKEAFRKFEGLILLK